MACKADSNAGVGADSDTVSLAALDAVIATQGALLAQQLADIDRLYQLKASLDSGSDMSLPIASPAPPGQVPQNVRSRLMSTLAGGPTLVLSTHADLALKLPPALDWAAFSSCDPAPVRAFAGPGPAPALTSASVPGLLHQSPSLHRSHCLSQPRPRPRTTVPLSPSSLQTLVRHAAHTILGPRMRQYPRVSTPSPPPSPRPSAFSDGCDPINARRASEHAKIGELREAVRRGGAAGGLRMMCMGMGVIRTDVGEDAMRAVVRIDDGDDDDGDGTGMRLGKGNLPAKGGHLGKYRGTAVPAAYLHANADEGGGNTGGVPSQATKYLGLAVVRAARSALERDDVDADVDLALSDRDRKLHGACLVSPPPPFECVHAATGIIKARAKQTPRRKSKAKPEVIEEEKARPRAKAKAPINRTKKDSHQYTDDDDDDDDVRNEVMDEEGDEEGQGRTYRNPAGFVPSVTVYQSSSEDGEVDMLSVDGVHVDLNGDGADMDADMDVERSNANARAKVSTKKGQQKKGDGDSDAAVSTTAKSKSKRTSSSTPKPKPATFNLPWCTTEQHHLEQLLEEIPTGERLPWQQISRAMGGGRTQRQVASRVQKYTEKMRLRGLM